MLRRPPRFSRPAVVAAVAMLGASVLGWLLLRASNPGVYWQQTDLQVYRDAGAAVVSGHALYPQRFGPAQLPFSYPPFAALVFAVGSSWSLAAWRVAMAASTCGALVVSAFATVRLAGVQPPRRTPAAFVLAAIGLWLEPVQSTLLFGQIDVVIMALVLADLAWASTSRWAGVGVGVAAGLKLTPLIFLVFLLGIGRRRAALTGLVTFAATVVLGAIVLPVDTRRYWSGRIAEPGDNPARLVNQSLYGVVLRALHRTGGEQVWWSGSAVLVAAVGLAAAVWWTRAGRPLWGIALCAVAGLLASPISWTHHWVWAVALLGAVASTPGRWGWALTAGVVVLFGWWALPIAPDGGWRASIAPHPTGWVRIAPHEAGRELHWTAWQAVYGNAYVLAAVLLVVVAAVGVPRTRRWQR